MKEPWQIQCTLFDCTPPCDPNHQTRSLDGLGVGEAERDRVGAGVEGNGLAPDHGSTVDARRDHEVVGSGRNAGQGSVAARVGAHGRGCAGVDGGDGVLASGRARLAASVAHRTEAA